MPANATDKKANKNEGKHVNGTKGTKELTKTKNYSLPVRQNHQHSLRS
jgi:hypothetical protein